jgi:hypothetical protein
MTPEEKKMMVRTSILDDGIHFLQSLKLADFDIDAFKTDLSSALTY